MSDRRHAAIMFTDIVGYTALMGSDEDRALEVLNKNRKIHSKLIEQFKGTLIKEMGDGMLISFNLASDAVRCAIEIQKASKEQDIPLKIGIHEGEMVFEGNDVLGDGVNIASRLESDTKEGCITISGSVYRDIKNKTGIQTEFIGEKSFKNVDEPLKVYRVLCEEGVSKPAKNTNSKKSKNEKIKYFYYILAGMFIVSSVVFLIWEYLPQKRTKELDKSIAVLPFINMSNDPGHEYFSDGITEEIITQLANIKDLSVRSRTSVFQYKNNPKEIPQIGNELGVSYVLEGSVRRDQDMVRITIQLINAITDTHVWAENYDRKLEGVLEIQSEVAKKVAEMLDITLSSSEKKRIERKPTEKFTAYEYYLRAMHEDKKWTVEGSQKAVEYLEKALELDPEFSEAYSLYTWQYIQLSVTYQVMSTREALKLALPAAQKAVKYDSLSSDAYIMNASVNYYLEWNFEQAEKKQEHLFPIARV